MKFKVLMVFLCVTGFLVTGHGAAASGGPAPVFTLDPGGHKALIKDVAFTPDGRVVAVGGWLPGNRIEHDAIRLHDVRTGRVLGLLKGHANVVLSLAFSPDGRYLASGDGASPPTVRVWDVRRQRQVHVFKGHKKPIYALAFSPDGRCLVSGSYDHTLRLWDVTTGKRLAVLTGHTDKVYSVA